MSKHIRHTIHASDAEFLGWQETNLGDIFPLYNILKRNHPSNGSTVSEDTLLKFKLRVPKTLSPYPDSGPTPWHSMSRETNNVLTAREAIEVAGMDFTVVKVPLGEVMAKNHSADTADRWATVRTDTGAVLGIVRENYKPIQNSVAFTFFDNLVRSNDAIYETVGVLGGGKRIWILAKLPGYITVHKKDLVAKYLLLSNSHDGSQPVQVKLTPIRAVCNNTLFAALNGAEDIRIRRALNPTEDLKQARSLLGLSHFLYDQLEVVFNRMSLTKITDRQLMDYVKSLIPDNEEGRNNASTKAIRNSVLELYESGQGAELSRGTIWGALNAITEYTDHSMEVNPNTCLESNWFGPGEQLKLRAFQLADRMS